MLVKKGYAYVTFYSLSPTYYYQKVAPTYQNIQGTNQFLGDYLKISLVHLDITYVIYVNKQSDSS